MITKHHHQSNLSFCSRVAGRLVLAATCSLALYLTPASAKNGGGKPGGGGNDGGGSTPTVEYRVSWIDWPGNTRLVAFNVNKDGLAVGGIREADGTVFGFLASPSSDPESSQAEVLPLDTFFAGTLTTDPTLVGLRIALGIEINAAGQVAGLLVPIDEPQPSSSPEVYLFRGDLTTGAIEILGDSFAGNAVEIADMNEVGDVLAQDAVATGGTKTLTVFEASGAVAAVDLTSPAACLNSSRQTLYRPASGTTYRFSFDTEPDDDLNQGLRNNQGTAFYHLAESGAAYGAVSGLGLAKWDPINGHRPIGVAGDVIDVSTAVSDEEVLIQNGSGFSIYRDSAGPANLALSPTANTADDLARWNQATGWRYDVWSVSQPAVNGRGYISGTPAVDLEQTYAFILTPVIP